MKKLSNTLFALTVLALAAAVWSPVGDWWQWVATAVLLLFAGASTYAAPQDEEPTHQEKENENP